MHRGLLPTLPKARRRHYETPSCYQSRSPQQPQTSAALFRSGTTGRKQGDVHTSRIKSRKILYGNLVITKIHLLACGTQTCQRNQFFIGNLRSCNTDNITSPTPPVAPTIATTTNSCGLVMIFLREIFWILEFKVYSKRAIRAWRFVITRQQ